MKSMALRLATHAVLGLLWVLHWLPLAMLAPLGEALGLLLWAVARHRRHVALTNLRLCFPDQSEQERRAIAIEHFQFVGRSLLERGLLWHASEARLRRLIHIEGPASFADHDDAPVMWLVPHFVALDVAAIATRFSLEHRRGCTIYQTQSNAVFDAAMRRGRMRFGHIQVFSRQESAKPMLRAIRDGEAFFNLPDMDFGPKHAAFVPFFGVPTATLLTTSRLARLLDMKVQRVVAEMLPGSKGYRVRFLEPWEGFPTDDSLADTRAVNAWIEEEIRGMPAQYLWVHKRFKTRPKGDPSPY
jgi:Kdo2-lipid IVA lauroyltransferase/acyltransferase